MSVRRVIAATRNGRSGVVSEETGLTNAFATVPGFDPVIAWSFAPGEGAQVGAGHRADASCIPKAGGSSLLIVTFPPEGVEIAAPADPVAMGQEYVARLPGLAQTFEPDHPGMHTTPTIDYAIVFDGSIVCEFDDGQVQLERGDVLVNYATRHAWRNHSGKPATMIFILNGIAQ